MKIVLVSSLLPSGHYSEFVAEGLVSLNNVELFVYTDNDEKNKNFRLNKSVNIKNIWPKNTGFIFAIIKQLLKDKPNIVHLQHEINMFGGTLTALLFPWLVALIRIVGIPVVVTIHSVVSTNDLDHKFGYFFFHESILSKPVIYKIIFYYLYRTICLFSNSIIVHTNLTRDSLINNYRINNKIINVIPASIPVQVEYDGLKSPYFFYFGYLARRKGIDYLLEGFKAFLIKNPEKDFKLILAGGVIKGQELAREEIKNKIEKLEITNNVQLRGFIDEHEQIQLYQEAYAVVIPALISMGSSGPLYHATSHSKAVLCSRVGHFIEDVEEGVTGLLVENEQWDKAFLYAVNNPNHIFKMANAARLRSKERSPKKTANLYLNIYKKLLHGKPL